MMTEKSCGAVIFTRENGQIRYVLIHGKKGIWGFPKGHMEGSETETETALREIGEETGLRVRFIEGFREQDAYSLVHEGKPDTIKTVVYFLAEYFGQPLLPRDDEIAGIALFSYEEALERVQKGASKEILGRAAQYIRSMG